MVGKPSENRHSLQIEINRHLILDDETKEKAEAFDQLRTDVTKLIGKICDYAKAKVNGG